MEMKPIWAGAIFFGGWLIFYLFGRQIVFNFTAAYPTMKKMRAQDKDLLAPGADKYTLVSVIVCFVVFLLVSGIVVRFCKTYQIICYFIGVLAALAMYLPNCRIKTRSTFEIFCSAYSRFVPDDELRTAMFNRDPNAMRRRLRDMGYDDGIVPEFKT